MKILLVVAACFIAAAVYELSGILLTLVFKKKIIFGRLYTSKKIRLLMFAAKLAVALKIKQKECMRCVIDLNNKLIEIVNKPFSARKVLMLLPRCLQNQACGANVAADIENCKACGKCNIAELSLMKRDKSLEIFIATGSEIAQSKIDELRPDYVVAIACERELFLGLTVITDVPVYAVYNQQPEGPCKNTIVDTTMIKFALHLAGV